MTTWVKSLVQAWGTDKSGTIPSARPQSSGRKEPSHSQHAKKVEAKLADGDVRGALRLLESEETVAPDNPETLAALQRKHPPHPQPTAYPDPPQLQPDVTAVTNEELLKAVSSFPSGSAGGLDSLRPAILKDLLAQHTGDEGTDLAGTLCQFMDLVLSGRVPESVVPIFFGASLTALSKKGGGIRPIAVGSTLRRLAAKIILSRITDQFVSHFKPHQLGVGVRGGAEIGAHAARAYVNAVHAALRVFLKIGFKNAFNEVRRDRRLEVVLRFCPSIYAFVAQAYRSPTILFFGSHPISSSCGIQQGDPIGAALFSLLIQSIVESVNTELNIWYLDDGSMGDTPEAVLQALKEIIIRSSDLGLEINPNKCELAILGPPCDHEHVLREFEALAPGIQHVQPADLTLLGSPLTDASLDRVLAEKTQKMASFSERLGRISAHSAFYLLRASITMPRLQYFLRCAPAFKNHAKLVEYDSTLKSLLEGVLNCSLGPEAWLQSSLPVKTEGLGVRQALETAIPSFIASCYSVLPEVSALLPADIGLMDADVEEAMDMWTASVIPLERPPEALRKKQESWEAPLFALSLAHIRRTADGHPEDQARLAAVAQPEASAWLSVLPSPQLGTHLTSESFRIAVALRLGCDICEPHRCQCGTNVTSRGYHGLSCRRSAGRLSRHAAANAVISRALRTAEVPNILEPAGCSRADGKRPDAMSLIPWKRGRCVIWDFTCPDTLAPSHLPSTSLHGAGAAEAAAAKKHRKYAYLGDRFIFHPVAVDTLGSWDSDGLRFVREIGVRIPSATGEPRAVSYLMQRVSLAVQRGNVAAILGTLPSGATLDEIFYF